MRAAPFFPGQEMTTIFAVSADDASLHFDVSNLTPKQMEDDQSNSDMMGFLQTSLMGLGKPGDHVMFYDTFLEGPWLDRLNRFADFFSRLGFTPIPPENRHFHRQKGYYDSIAANLPEADSITLYMTSGTNSVLHNDPAAYAVSQNVNSKVHFAQHAPGFGIPVPDTMVTTKGALGGDEVAAFMAKHDNKLMLKTLGLAGARNVTTVDSLQECQDYVADYEDDMEVILQQRLDLTRYTEMTADLIVKPDSIELSNVRQIMFAEGIWVGNLIGPDVTLTEEQLEGLMQVGDYARAQGYVEPEGVNCGVDYFIADDGGDKPFIVTEINCRWTGGLYPAETIRRAGATEETCISMVDLVSEEGFDRFVEFMDQHLYGESTAGFGLMPIGFSPVPQEIEGTNNYFMWIVIAGDFEAFQKARREQLGAGILDRADTISMEL
jgi:hypothetical protein